MDIMGKSEDYAMAEVILSKFIDRMLQNTSDWKEIFESIMYLFGDNLDLHVEFWEKVADDINSMISTELVEWLSRLQHNLLNWRWCDNLSGSYNRSR